MHIFEIHPHDIASLSDHDLRALVGLLCEVECRRSGLPIGGIEWGGNNDSKDGGLDVTVRIKSNKLQPSDGFIPRKLTGYQVKKSNITPSAIEKEMKPNGDLRVSIKKLIQYNGAYIIISAATVAHGQLEKRKEAMRKAVARYAGNSSFHVDFFDASKLATWTRQHPGAVMWLREKITRPLNGWRSFGNWSRKGNATESFLFDDRSRFWKISSLEDGMSAIDGLKKFQQRLSRPNASLRLTGLSGVGKTRFAQALFEDHTDTPLDHRLAIYTDLSDNPQPGPLAMSEQLNAHGAVAILIVDNCPPEMHHSLTLSCNSAKGNVRLLTIEYDVRDDQPEATDVYIMRPLSDELITKLIARRFPRFESLHATIVAESAGGNARIALALASTITDGEPVPVLRDNNLFLRLFVQRNDNDESLLIAAEACSLLYSFEGTSTGPDSELEFLARMVNVSADHLYRKVNTLIQRELVQCRSYWRSVLPQALAHWLARKALKAIPLDRLLNAFEEQASPRLLRSFSKRLSYLTGSDEAVYIAQTWLDPSGFIGRNSSHLNELEIGILLNIAPLAPTHVLDLIVHALDENASASEDSAHPNAWHFVELLNFIAYDRDLFPESVKVLCRLATSNDTKSKHAGNCLQSLFWYRSGATQATIGQRKAVILDLVRSRNEREQSLGMFLLSSAFETNFHQAGHYIGPFPRHLNLQPEKSGERLIWHRSFLKLCIPLSLEPPDTCVGNGSRILLGYKFMVFWQMGLCDMLEDAAKKTQRIAYWHDGWAVIKHSLLHNEELIQRDRLEALEQLLRPSHIVDEVRTLVRNYLSDPRISMNSGYEGNTIMGVLTPANDVSAMSASLSNDMLSLRAVLPELLVTGRGFFTNGYDHLYELARNIARECDDLASTWEMINTAFANIPAEQRKLNFILGFVSSFAKRNNTLLHTILDGLVDDHVLRPHLPEMMKETRMNDRNIARLKLLLMRNDVDLDSLETIGNASFQAVADDQFILLIEALLLHNDGAVIAIPCIYHRIKAQTGRKRTVSKELMQIGCKVLTAHRHLNTQARHDSDSQLAFLAKKCLRDNKEATALLCTNLVHAFEHERALYGCDELPISIANMHPKIFLDVFVTAEDMHPGLLAYFRSDAFDVIAEQDVLAWCAEHPHSIPALMRLLSCFTPSSWSSRLKWLPVTYKLLAMAPELQETLTALKSQLLPASETRSYEWLEGRIRLLDKFDTNNNPGLKKWVDAIKRGLKDEIKTESVLPHDWDYRWRAFEPDYD